ncbi:MAG TPA: hypothetical protein VMO26_25205 [Vicinamibacterales bacterium]|nr:hypothetical protein [Vicinamibacterales bacterium]
MRGPTIGGLVLVLTATLACSLPPLATTHDSADDLVREVLAAFASRDDGRLRALALDEEEFRRHVWPSLPAARPERNLPFDYVWGDLQQKSDNRLRANLGMHGGRSYQLRGITFSGGTTEYSRFRVHRDALLEVRDSAGADHEIRLFGSAIEMDGAWKVFSFNADD